MNHLRTEADQRVEISFECGLGATALKRTEIGGFRYVRMESLTATVGKTATGAAVIPAGFGVLLINHSGTLLIRDSADSSLCVAPPRSALFVRGSTRLIVQAARGEHVAQMATWPLAQTPSGANGHLAVGSNADP